MADHELWTFAPAGPAVVESCWMCGIRLPASRMVADGTSACTDVRWYCLDVRGCTERWTTRSAKPADNGQGSARTTERRDKKLAAQPA
jgi:hypothetical protein